MKKHILIYIILLIIGFCTPVWAQTNPKQNTNFRAVAMPAPNKITVLILGAPLLPKTTQAEKWIGYHVYRAEQGSKDFKRVTKTPVSAAKDANAMAQTMGSSAIKRLMRDLKVRDYQGVFNYVLNADATLSVPARFNISVAEAFGLCWHDTDIKAGQQYSYYITKVKADGTETPAPAPESISTATAGKPLATLAKVNYLKGDAFADKIRLEFSKDENGQFRHIYRSEDSLSNYLQQNDLPMMSSSDPKQKYDIFIDSALVPNNTYYYVVATADVVGNEVFSDTIVVKSRGFRTPPTPEMQNAISTTEGLQLTWTVRDISKIVGFRLLRRDSNANSPSLQDDNDKLYMMPDSMLIAPTDTSYTDVTAISGNSYFYKLISVDKYGVHSPSPVPFYAVYFSKRAPVPPINIRATSEMKKIRIEWDTNKEKDVKGYIVYRSYKDSENREPISPLLDPNVTSFVDSTSFLSKRISFAYYIKALNQSENESPFSKPVYASPLEPKVAPKPMNSLRGDYNAFLGNQLRWSEAYDPETFGVRIYRKEASTPSDALWQLIYQESLTSGKFAYIDSLIDRQESYLYKMCAISDDSIQSEFSEIQRIDPSIPALQAPNEVVIDADGNNLRVGWTPIIGGGIQTYAVYRRNGGSASKKIAEVSVGNHFYQDKVTEKGTYYYRIVPIHKSGKEGNSSEEVSYQIKSL